MLVIQALMVAAQAAWLSLAAYSNLRYPRTNRDYVVQVMTMELTKEDPNIYEDHKHRRLTSRPLMNGLFAMVAVAEALIALALWLSSALLLASLCGFVTAEVARTAALLSVASFTAIWAAFLVGGQWFHYWVSSISPQNTHFSMLFWGLFLLLLLS